MFCPKCGSKNDDSAKFCASCGATFDESANASSAAQSPSLEASIESHENASGAQVTTINVQTSPVIAKNSIGTAGFVLALIAVFTSWIPVLGWILWVLGALLSIIGLFKAPKGLAIAGTVISFIDFIILIIVVAGCSAAVGGLGGASAFL